jgi:hypothetical protein
MTHVVQHRVSLIHISDGNSVPSPTTDQRSQALRDAFKVAVFLAATVGCRYYLTSELHSSVEGTSETSLSVPTQDATPSPNLMDLSTVRL